MDRTRISDNDGEGESMLTRLIGRLCLLIAYWSMWSIKCLDLYSSWLYHHIRSQFIQMEPDLKQNLNLKSPEHLAICLGLEDSSQINMEKLKEMIDWSETLSIKTLTIYHYSDLLSNINDIKDLFMIGSKKIKVNFISLQSSHQSLIETAREFSNNDNQKVTAEQISNNLQKNQYYSSPDPQLLLCFNGNQCLQAYPPWQIRLTEIVFLKSHHMITKSLFISQLERFSRCVQRFGQ